MSERDRRKALEAIFGKLAKLLPHLGNDNPAEADNARQAINRLLASAKLDWHDLVSLLSDRKDPLFEMLKRLMEKDQDALVRLGFAGATFFRSTAGAVFADVMVDRHRTTWPLSSSEFSDWLVHQFFKERRAAPGLAAMKAALRTLGAHARFDGAQHEVHLRIAESGAKVYLDIGDQDWHAVEIDTSGWRVVQDPPVRFRRTQGMTALPLPQRGGSIEQLRRFVNLSDVGFVLYVAGILDAFRPCGSHPVLYLAGEEGSAKSTAGRIARALVDPSDVPLRTLPNTVRDLFIDVHGAHTLMFDNVSTIRPAISDALCQISSGTGFGTRKLFTDTGQLLVSGSRLIILNGLTSAINRSDLADRTVVLPLSPTKPERRRSEAQLWSDFERDRPLILGALLDCIVYGLRRLPHVYPKRLPRMADFALWAIACEEAFAAPGAFLAAFEASAAEAVEVVVEGDPVAVAIGAFMIGRHAWSGTAAQLLHDLTTHDRAEARPTEWTTWPRNPTALGIRLRAAAASLRKTGVEVVVGKATDRARTRVIELRKIERTENQQQPPSRQRQAAGAADASDGSDGNRAVAKVIQFSEN